MGLENSTISLRQSMPSEDLPGCWSRYLSARRVGLNWISALKRHTPGRMVTALTSWQLITWDAGCHPGVRAGACGLGHVGWGSGRRAKRVPGGAMLTASSRSRRATTARLDSGTDWPSSLRFLAMTKVETPPMSSPTPGRQTRRWQRWAASAGRRTDDERHAWLRGRVLAQDASIAPHRSPAGRRTAAAHRWTPAPSYRPLPPPPTAHRWTPPRQRPSCPSWS